MKKRISITFACVAATLLVAAPLAPLMEDWQYIDNVLYLCDNTTDEAVLYNVYDDLGEYYSQEDFVVPASFTLSGGGISQGGSGGATKTYKITEIAFQGLYGASSSTLTFTAPSNLRVIREEGIKAMENLEGTLTLPKSLELIESQGVAECPITKLVLPSTLDSLSLSAILLADVDTIQFLGSVPPSCAIADPTEDAYNPWTSSDVVTSKDIVVIVPESALPAYQDAPGIGDYFTCLKKQPGPGTALEENAEAVTPQQKKVLRNGRLYILRDGVVYDAQGQKVK